MQVLPCHVSLLFEASTNQEQSALLAQAQVAASAEIEGKVQNAEVESLRQSLTSMRAEMETVSQQHREKW